VLVAEDHPSLARSIANGLRQEGFAVDLTFDGSEALHNLLHNPYDCAVLDVMMPGHDGWQIVEKIRKEGSKTPVLMLTARDALEDRVKGLNLGADDYLVKPFEFDELLARIRALARRSHGNASPLITVADLEIDTATKTVRRSGNPISLTSREYVLLEYLAQRAGQVVSRVEINVHIYDEHDDPVSNVLDVFIGYLRNKIDRGYSPKLIHTRRGMGYILASSPPE
jgi:two-component system copper resistance phosphate regulon response regulator CusR